MNIDKKRVSISTQNSYYKVIPLSPKKSSNCNTPLNATGEIETPNGSKLKKKKTGWGATITKGSKSPSPWSKKEQPFTNNQEVKNLNNIP